VQNAFMSIGPIRVTCRSPKENEGVAVLEMLFWCMENKLFRCRFKWRDGSFAVGDNRCALHHGVRVVGSA
jgi:hypothetical protein